MRRYAVSLSYVGTRFRGWARQPNGIPSVCEAVDDALDALVGSGSHGGAVVSSRTDAGVHALMNTFHVDITRRPRHERLLNAASSEPSTNSIDGSASELEIPIAAAVKPYRAVELVGGINAHLRSKGLDQDVQVLGALAVRDPEKWHARFSAVGREYVYRIIPSAGVNTAATEAPTTSMFGSYPDLFLPPEAGNHRPRRRRLPRRCRDSGTSGYDNENSDLGDLSTSACEVSSQLISRDSGGVLVPSIEEVVREFEGETTDHMSPKKYHCRSSSSSIRSGSIAVSEEGSSTSSRNEEEDGSLRWVGGQVPSPLFASHRAWCLAGGSTLNLTAMRAAAAHLEGEHDFSTFRGPDCHAHSPVKQVDSIAVDVLPLHPPLALEGTAVLTITVAAPRFLHRMVRNIVGCLVAVGRGNLPVSAVPKMLAARSRPAGKFSAAPAHGLYLTQVKY